MVQLLEGIDGARAIMDDILIGGKNEADHDAILQRAVNRATGCKLAINYEKCQIKKTSVNYAGHKSVSRRSRAWQG